MCIDGGEARLVPLRPSLRPTQLTVGNDRRDSVAGGPGAFVVAAKDFENFGVGVRREPIGENSAVPGQRPAERSGADRPQGAAPPPPIQAAAMCGTGWRTLHGWMHRYDAEGIAEPLVL